MEENNQSMRSGRGGGDSLEGSGDTCFGGFGVETIFASGSDCVLTQDGTKQLPLHRIQVSRNYVIRH
jgi:hypothetical protein